MVGYAMQRNLQWLGPVSNMRPLAYTSSSLHPYHQLKINISLPLTKNKVCPNGPEQNLMASFGFWFTSSLHNIISLRITYWDYSLVKACSWTHRQVAFEFNNKFQEEIQ
jgi:hypothetical protein